QMDRTAGFEQTGVCGEERRGREAFFRALGAELRIGEGDPDLVHLARREKRADEFDARADESYVAHPALRGGLRAAPHAGALDIDADVVAAGVALGERHGVFAFAAAQFEYDGTVVAEEIAPPMAFERVVAAE